MASCIIARFYREPTCLVGLALVLGGIVLTIAEGEAKPGFEQRVEWWRQFWGERRVGIDQNSLEERLIELPLDVVRRRLVGKSAVDREIKGTWPLPMASTSRPDKGSDLEGRVGIMVGISVLVFTALACAQTRRARLYRAHASI